MSDTTESTVDPSVAKEIAKDVAKSAATTVAAQVLALGVLAAAGHIHVKIQERRAKKAVTKTEEK